MNRIRTWLLGDLPTFFVASMRRAAERDSEIARLQHDVAVLARRVLDLEAGRPWQHIRRDA